MFICLLQLGVSPSLYPQRPGQMECDVRTHLIWYSLSCKIFQCCYCHHFCYCYYWDWGEPLSFLSRYSGIMILFGLHFRYSSFCCYMVKNWHSRCWILFEQLNFSFMHKDQCVLYHDIFSSGIKSLLLTLNVLLYSGNCSTIWRLGCVSLGKNASFTTLLIDQQQRHLLKRLSSLLLQDCLGERYGFYFSIISFR